MRRPWFRAETSPRSRVSSDESEELSQTWTNFLKLVYFLKSLLHTVLFYTAGSLSHIPWYCPFVPRHSFSNTTRPATEESPLKHRQATGDGDHILMRTERASVLKGPRLPRDLLHVKHLPASPSVGLFGNKSCSSATGCSSDLNSQQKDASASRHCANLQKLFI